MSTLTPSLEGAPTLETAHVSTPEDDAAPTLASGTIVSAAFAGTGSHGDWRGTAPLGRTAVGAFVGDAPDAVGAFVGDAPEVMDKIPTESRTTKAVDSACADRS
jgi:hypothetical protein